MPRYDIHKLVNTAEANRVWEEVGDGIQCDTAGGEVCLKKSPGKGSGLDECQEACENLPVCKSITYFKSTFCSLFSTACTSTRKNVKVSSMRLVEQQLTSTPSVTPGKSIISDCDPTPQPVEACAVTECMPHTLAGKDPFMHTLPHHGVSKIYIPND